MIFCAQMNSYSAHKKRNRVLTTLNRVLLSRGASSPALPLWFSMASGAAELTTAAARVLRLEGAAACVPRAAGGASPVGCGCGRPGWPQEDAASPAFASSLGAASPSMATSGAAPPPSSRLPLLLSVESMPESILRRRVCLELGLGAAKGGHTNKPSSHSAASTNNRLVICGSRKRAFVHLQMS